MDDTAIPVGLLELSESDLLYLLGGEVVPKQHGMMALDGIDELVNAAKQWLKESRPEIQGSVCGHPVVQAIRADKNLKSQRVLLLLAIADVFAGKAWSVSPFVVAALIIKQGLDELCHMAVKP